MHLAGPLAARLLFHGFVVVVGMVMLAGAVNTAIVGSNGVLNRVAEDGVLPDWFRHPHRRFGTTNRFINLIVLLQILTIVLSRGNVQMLGEAYAFGVVWSFAMKALSVLVLRYKMPEAREWKVPLNLRWGKTEIPVGLGLITLTLFAIGVVNILTKKVATIGGLTFSVVFFAAFEISERMNRRHRLAHSQELEKFRLETPDQITDSTSQIRPGNILVAVRNPNQLTHLERVLEKTDTSKIDIVVATVKYTGRPGFGEHEPTADEVFSADMAKLFSLVVTLAEKAGKHVELMVVPGRDPNLTLVETAQRLRSSLVVMGLSGKMTAGRAGQAVWRRLGGVARAATAALAPDQLPAQRRDAVLQPRTAPAAPVARGPGPAPPALARAERTRRGAQTAPPRRDSGGATPPGFRAAFERSRRDPRHLAGGSCTGGRGARGEERTVSGAGVHACSGSPPDPPSRRWTSGAALERDLQKSHHRRGRDKLKHVLHGASTVYGPTWGMLQLAQRFLQVPLESRPTWSGIALQRCAASQIP